MDPDKQITPYSPLVESLLKEREGASISVHPRGQPGEVPDLLEYWRIGKKRRGTILTILFVVFSLTLFATLKEKRIYEARTLIEIEKEDADIPTIQELFQVEDISDTYLETQDRILKSENLARHVIEELHLQDVPEFAPRARDRQNNASPAASSAQVFAAPDSSDGQTDIPNDVLRKFEDRLNVEPVKRSRLIEVTFDSNDPQLAARVVNTLASTYITENVQSRWDASERTSDWLSQQLGTLKAKLEKSEDELQQYASNNGLLFLETDKGTTENIVVQRLRELQQQLTQAEADRFDKESLYRLVQKGDYASIPGVFDDKTIQEVSDRLAELQGEKSRLVITFTPDYPKVKEVQNQIDEGNAVLNHELARAAKRVENDYQAAVDRENMLREAFHEQQKAANEIAERSVQYNILKREADTNKQLYVSLLEQLKETGMSASLKASNIHIVDPAYPPSKPSRPRILLNLSLGLLLGLCLGTGAAFLQENLDNTLKSSEEVEQFLQIPALGAVPAVDGYDKRSAVQSLYNRAWLLVGDKNGSNGAPHWNRIEGNGSNALLSEAFHGLRTSVLLSTAKKPPSSVLITSAQSGEGKTTVTANLALSLAQLGESVLLIDADLRRPSLHDFFGIESCSGLVNFLTGKADWRNFVWQSPTKGLSVLFCGPVPPNPVDLLSSESMPNLIREASHEYKFVLLDSPPLLNLSDSRILATLVDGVILVVGSGTTPRDVVHRAYTSVIDAGSRVLGTAVNFAGLAAEYYYASDYVPAKKSNSQ